MDDFLNFSEEPPESVEEFLKRNSFKENKPAFDPHELIVEVEIKEKEPENP